MEYVFIYVEFISLVSCAVVCSVPYVRREVYGFGWLPECLMSMPSSLCSQAHQHRHSTPHTNISSQQYLQNVERKKQHLCQHISRMVPLYRIFVSPSFTSLRRGTYGENESNHPTNHHQHEEHGTGREDMLCISVCVCVIVYSVVIFILFASFAFGSINMSNYALMAVEGKQRTKGGKKLNANTHPTFSHSRVDNHMSPSSHSSWLLLLLLPTMFPVWRLFSSQSWCHNKCAIWIHFTAAADIWRQKKEYTMRR